MNNQFSDMLWFYICRFEDMPVMLSPYEFLNLRNHLKDTKAYFVVLARFDTDISKAVQFAAKHNLALSIFGTGHEFQVSGTYYLIKLAEMAELRAGRSW